MKFQNYFIIFFCFYASAVGTLTDLCPHGFIMTEYFGAYLAKYWILRWTVKTASFVIMTVGLLESNQMTIMSTTVISSILLPWERITILVANLSYATKSQFNNVAWNYRQMQVVAIIGRKIVMTMLSIIFVGWLIVISGFNYVTLKLYGKMPFVVYIVAPYISALITVVVYLLLPALISIHTKWKDGLGNLKLGKVRKSEERMIVSSIPIWGLECGLSATSFYRIEEDYKAEFFMNVVNNTWNLLLTFP